MGFSSKGVPLSPVDHAMGEPRKPYETGIELLFIMNVFGFFGTALTALTRGRITASEVAVLAFVFVSCVVGKLYLDR